MDIQKQAENNLFARIRNHRLGSTFVLLGLLSAGILAGSVLTRWSAPRTRPRLLRRPPAGHSQARSTSPTLHQDCQRGWPGRGQHQHRVHPQAVHQPPLQPPRPGSSPSAAIRAIKATRATKATCRTSSTASSAARSAMRRRRRFQPSAAARARRSAQASSSTPAATSSPTIMSSIRQIRSTSSSPPTPTTHTDKGRLPCHRRGRRYRHRRDQDRRLDPCPPSNWATPTERRWATGCWPSASPSASPRPSLQASSPPRTAPSTNLAPTAEPTSSRSSSRPTPPSTPATPAARWWIWPAKSSA